MELVGLTEPARGQSQLARAALEQQAEEASANAADAAAAQKAAEADEDRQEAEAKKTAAAAKEEAAAAKAAEKQAAEAQAAQEEAEAQAAQKEAAAKAAEKRAADEAAEAKAAEEEAAAAAANKSNDPADAKAYAEGALASFGWGAGQLGCLETLWNKESEWSISASNPSSGAYGIPQALPGNKMAAAGSDWQTNFETQIDWGLGYIESRYGSPCSALSFHLANNWY